MLPEQHVYMLHAHSNTRASNIMRGGRPSTLIRAHNMHNMRKRAAAPANQLRTATTADAAVARHTKCVRNARSVSHVTPAWKADSFNDDTKTPRIARVTAVEARACVA